MGCRKNTKNLEYNLSENKKNLKERGRVQFFYHCPYSKLPIRDVIDKEKIEPHIEIGAENYWVSCYQSNNIKPFIDKNEKYIFLMTTCQNKKLKKFYRKKFIVGYIKRGGNGKRNGKHFVKEETSLFSFKDSLPISDLGYSKYTRVKLVDENDTKKILEHFKKKNNILKKCVKEIKNLDKEDITCLRKDKGRKCYFKNECLRWNNENSTESKGL